MGRHVCGCGAYEGDAGERWTREYLGALLLRSRGRAKASRPSYTCGAECVHHAERRAGRSPRDRLDRSHARSEKRRRFDLSHGRALTHAPYVQSFHYALCSLTLAKTVFITTSTASMFARRNRFQ